MTSKTRDEHGRFRKGATGNPHGRPRLADTYRERLREHADDLIAALVQQARSGDMQAIAFALGRLIPPLKPSSEPVTLSLPGDVGGQARAIVEAAATGKITTDEALGLLSSLKLYNDIAALPELRREIEQLKAQGTER
jgi:uncharacterized small protein (DUF1192 family)